jgi:hypothetical protein
MNRLLALGSPWLAVRGMGRGANLRHAEEETRPLGRWPWWRDKAYAQESERLCCCCVASAKGDAERPRVGEHRLLLLLAPLQTTT